MSHLLRKLILFTLTLFAVSLISSTTLAQISTEPSILSDQKPGSVLFFNKYTSDPIPTEGREEDTQINITNTNQHSSVEIHLFFVDGRTCKPADTFCFLTPNQTLSFRMSEFDPGVQGYIIIVATSGGLPTLFNHLIGDAYIREADGRQANLPAVSVARRCSGTVSPNGDGTASLIFDGVEYDRLPQVVAVSSFNSQMTDSTHLAIYSPTNNLMTEGASSIGIFTLVYDDAEHVRSTSFRVSCYAQIPLSSLRVINGLNNFVPAGHTGWVRLSCSGRPLLGAVLHLGPFFNGGHNLHHLTLLDSYTILVPAWS
jgi:hypothetical protein